jgi:hypothetical protein
VMQGLVDVGRIQATSTIQKTLFTTVNFSLLHFTHDIKDQINTFTPKYM